MTLDKLLPAYSYSSSQPRFVRPIREDEFQFSHQGIPIKASRNELGLSSSPEQTRILSQFSLDPSLRINNGLSSLNRRGDVNGTQGVPNNGGISHPSSGEYRIEGESRGAKAEGDIPDYSGGVQLRSIQEKDEGYAFQFSHQGIPITASRLPLCFSMADETEQSVRVGRLDIENVTARDAKHPKERSKDRAYKARFSLGSSVAVNGSFSSPPPMEKAGWEKTGVYSQSAVGHADLGSSPMDYPSPADNRVPYGRTPAALVFPGTPFYIRLIFEGSTVRHRVWASMSIDFLMEEVGGMFGLNSSQLILVLFTSSPTSLLRGKTISGPPRVEPDSMVMVFVNPGSSHPRDCHSDSR